MAFAALGAYAPFFPSWLTARGIDGLAMGAISALLPAMSVLGPPAFGAASDALGLRSSLLRVACLGSFVAFASVAVMGLTHVALGFGAILAATFLFALFRSPMVLLADVLAVEESRMTGATYASIRLFGSLGFLTMALAAGHFLDPESAVGLPVAIAAPLLVALGATFGLPREMKPPPAPLRDLGREVLGRPAIRSFLLVSLFHTLAHANHELNMTLHLRSLGASPDFAGLVWATGVMSEVVLMAFASRIFRVASPAACIAIGVCGGAIRWALIASVTSKLTLLMIQPLHAISFGLTWMASVTFLKENVEPRAAGTAQGLFGATAGVGSVAGMLVWGSLFRSGGGHTTFSYACVVSLVTIVLAIAFVRRARAPSLKT